MASIQVQILLLLLVSSPTSTCKGKAESKARAAAAQKNDNGATATTNINMGDTNLLDGYHEETVVMSVASVFIAAIIFAVCLYFIRRHGLCKKPARNPAQRHSRSAWSNMSLRTLRQKVQDDCDPRFEDLGHCHQIVQTPRMPISLRDRCSDLKDIADGKSETEK